MAIGGLEVLVLLFICGVPLFLLIVFGLVLAARSRSGQADQTTGQAPLEILQQRYARGEIDTEEYEHRRNQILRDSE